MYTSSFNIHRTFIFAGIALTFLATWRTIQMRREARQHRSPLDHTGVARFLPQVSRTAGFCHMHFRERFVFMQSPGTGDFASLGGSAGRWEEGRMPEAGVLAPPKGALVTDLFIDTMEEIASSFNGVVLKEDLTEEVRRDRAERDEQIDASLKSA
jgi:hypothetical protein